jgi:hypothetical protein
MLLLYDAGYTFDLALRCLGIGDRHVSSQPVILPQPSALSGLQSKGTAPAWKLPSLFSGVKEGHKAAITSHFRETGESSLAPTSSRLAVLRLRLRVDAHSPENHATHRRIKSCEVSKQVPEDGVMVTSMPSGLQERLGFEAVTWPRVPLRQAT